MATLGFTEDTPITHKMMSKNIENSQKRVEGFNYDRRKALLDYDNVISKQREIVYERRNEILDKDSIRDRVLSTFKEFVVDTVNDHFVPEDKLTHNDIVNICEIFNANLLKSEKLKEKDLEEKEIKDIQDYIYSVVLKDYENKLKDVPEEIQNDFEKAITLRVLDKNWMNQLDNLEHLKEGIGLR